MLALPYYRYRLPVVCSALNLNIGPEIFVVM